MKKYNISNSLLNAFTDYKNGDLCGLRFKTIYIDKTLTTPTSESQQAGQFFEYLCTGAKLRNGEKPQPIMIKSGLNALCRVLEQQKINFDNIYKDFPEYKTSVTLEIELNDFNFKGIFDVLIEKENQIRDIKTTGDINDIWERYGWGDSEKNPLKDKPLMNQAKMYCWLYWKNTGIIPAFYFDVFSNKNNIDCKTIKVEISENVLIEFETYLLATAEIIDFENNIGFEPIPEMSKCLKCELKGICENAKFIPEIQIVKLK